MSDNLECVPLDPTDVKVGDILRRTYGNRGFRKVAVVDTEVYPIKIICYSTKHSYKDALTQKGFKRGIWYDDGGYEKVLRAINSTKLAKKMYPNALEKDGKLYI